MKLSELYWHRVTPLHVVLWPLSVLYGFFLAIKKACYWLDIFHSVRLPVPVILVDSISVDDGGKTPLLLWLVDCLKTQGFSPGIIACSNFSHSGAPAAVTPANDPRSVDAKTFLLAQHCGQSCPIWVGRDRIAAAYALLNAHPECNIIICNSGIQDFRLERDAEVIVVNLDEQSLGNGLQLPAGPLRMSLDSLKPPSIIVTQSNQGYRPDTSRWGKTYTMKLTREIAYKVCDPEIQQPVSDFRSKQLQAISDTENFRWFFDFIQKSGLDAQFHSYAENHRFTPQEISFAEADAVLMPEENALQCRAFADDKLWALPEKAWIDSELQSAILRKLSNTQARNRKN